MGRGLLGGDVELETCSCSTVGILAMRDYMIWSEMDVLVGWRWRGAISLESIHW